MPAPLPFFDTKSMLGRFGAARFCGILYGTICPARRKRARPCARATCSGSLRGGVAEWLKAAVLKTVVPQGTVGSNPTAFSTRLVFFIKAEFKPNVSFTSILLIR